MGSHCSFRHLKHKLWPKEGSRVKLPVWLPTRKSQESTRFTWLQTTCDIALESSRRELQLCFGQNLDPRSARKVMGLQSCGSRCDFGTPARESRERKAIWMWAPWRGPEYTIREKVVASPQVRAVMSLVCPCCPWLVLAPKVLQLCTNHFVWVMCRPVWVSKASQLFLVPSRNSNTPLYPSKCYELRSVPRLLPLPLSFTWTHIWVLPGVGSASFSQSH